MGVNEPPAPTRIGRYDIQRELGRGMMGIVYQARDSVLQRNVALKTISLAFAVSEQERETFEARFLQEARAAATLAHPGIVVVYDVGIDLNVGTLYMALEFLRGKTLESVLATGHVLDWREALRTIARVAEALHHAHAHGIVHRDVKPANIMILASGEPKVMDFGVAKLEGGQLTTRGQVLGSPPYMSPEQTQGESLDARSDLANRYMASESTAGTMAGLTAQRLMCTNQGETATIHAAITAAVPRRNNSLASR